MGANDQLHKDRTSASIGPKMIQMSPTKDPVETAELLAFTRIVEAKSLSRAAAELGVPRAGGSPGWKSGSGFASCAERREASR
jgi:hypothetical protein